MSVRTRFAPSPTGYLHIGNARTALYAYLYARQHKGDFILRIEDTDRERSTEASKQIILDDMAWLGLNFDEGPYYQTHRLERYHEIIKQMLANNQAYRCICSVERLSTLREQQIREKRKPRYDACCRNANITSDCTEPFVIRFKNPLEGEVTFSDLVYGDVTVSNTELDDLIIARPDGMPTYNFTVVVDDWDMNISHVIRGDDHVNNTPRQINILNSLNAPIPVYAHLPMILGEDGKRLSKRHGAASVLEFHEMGYLPHALLNYLVRLGWAHGDQEIFSLDDMIQLFALEKVSKSPAAFSIEKLNWLNQHYLKTDPPSEQLDNLSYQFKKLDIDTSEGPSLVVIIKLHASRCKTLSEMAEMSRYFYQAPIEYDETASAEFLSTDSLPLIEHIRDQLCEMSDWTEEALKNKIQSIMKEWGLKMPQVAQALRVVVSGNIHTPGINTTLAVLGKETTLSRLDSAIEWIKS